MRNVQNGSADTSNFDEEFTREQPTLTPVHGQLSSRDQAEFNGFSWVRLSSLPLALFEVLTFSKPGCLVG